MYLNRLQKNPTSLNPLDSAKQLFLPLGALKIEN